MKKHFFKVFCFLMLCAGVLAGCGRAPDRGVLDHRPVIVCTLFPQYDFARTVFGDEAEVVMLLEPGTESHMYDPSPGDMVMISSADAFVYTGDEMEPWAARIVESLSDVRILDLSENVQLQMEDEHAHETDGHDGHSHHDHEHSYDPHFWLDMDNALAMLTAVENLATEMGVDSQAASERVAAYREKLEELDSQYFELLESAGHRDIVFAGRFAYGYFVHRYNLDYETVYHSCSAEADPGVYDMARIIDYIRAHHTKVIFHEELSSANVARTIAADTGAEIRMLSTAHNVTREEFDAGITFYDIMKNNLDVLKEALE